MNWKFTWWHTFFGIGIVVLVFLLIFDIYTFNLPSFTLGLVIATFFSEGLLASVVAQAKSIIKELKKRIENDNVRKNT